jgi:hypothetical protein
LRRLQQNHCDYLLTHPLRCQLTSSGIRQTMTPPSARNRETYVRSGTCQRRSGGEVIRIDRKCSGSRELGVRSSGSPEQFRYKAGRRCWGLNRLGIECKCGCDGMLSETRRSNDLALQAFTLIEWLLSNAIQSFAAEIFRDAFNRLPFSPEQTGQCTATRS